MISVGSGDLDLENGPVTEENLVDDTLAIIVISDGEFIDFCSVLFLVIELLDNMDSLTIVVISECDFMQLCSVLFLLVEELEPWSESEGKFGNDSFVFVMIPYDDLIDYCSIVLFTIVEL